MIIETSRKATFNPILNNYILTQTQPHIVILLLALLLTMNSCFDDYTPSNEPTVITIDHETKVIGSIKTEYNPIVLDMHCVESTTIKLHIPEPYPNDMAKRMSAKKRGVEAHSLEVFMDSVLMETIMLNSEFFVKHNDREFRNHNRIVEYKMPRFSKKIKRSGTITLNLISEGELITSYSTSFHYLDHGEEMDVIKRSDIETYRTKRPMQTLTSDPTFKLTKTGVYTDDVTYTHIVKKEEDHYVSSYTAKGNAIYHKAKRDNKFFKWKKYMALPESLSLSVKIPLGFELEEKVESRLNTTKYIIDKKNNDQKLFFDSHYLEIGKRMDIQFSNCEMQISNEEVVSIPVLDGLGWGNRDASQ